MKKRTLIFIAYILSFVFALSAFGVGASAAPVEPASVTIASGGVGGSWYILNAALNDVWEQKVPGLLMSIIPGGGSSNPAVVQNGGAVMGMTYAGDAMAAYTGGSEAHPEAKTDIRGFANLNMKQYLTILVTKETEISSFADIREKKPALKCSIGPRGSGSAQMFERAFAAHGITIADLESWGGRVEYTSPQDGGNGIRDGHLNLMSCSSPLKDPFMTEAATAREMVLIPLEKAAVDELVKAHGYSAWNIPKDTYLVPNGDVNTITDVTMILVNQSMDENLAYEMAKLLCENKDALKATHNLWTNFDTSQVRKMPIPLHPGAERYYTEMGY